MSRHFAPAPERVPPKRLKLKVPISDIKIIKFPLFKIINIGYLSYTTRV